MKRVVSSFFCLWLFSYAQAQQKEGSDPRVIELNIRATLLLYVNPDSALILLDSSIKIDSNFYSTYFTKVNAYCQKGSYLKAIETSHIGLRQKPEMVESILYLGMLYDKTLQPENAKAQYLKALQIIEKRFKKLDELSSDDKLNYVLLLLLLDREDAKKELEKIRRIDEDIDFSMLKDFEKKKFIQYLFPK